MGRWITLTVNGFRRSIEVKDNEILLDVLRDKLKVKSVKAACWRGECGLCTILLNGKLVKSCLVLAVEVDGSEILTVEGLAKNGELAPIQRAFIEHGATQCGFCTPAFVIASHKLLQENPSPSEDEIKESLSGILCRCGTYYEIIEAIKNASKYYQVKREI
ncbi:MAG: (2Fe-2S)-binding protein [Thaumarchaeota archaeon]|jgi:carbon-monoxide dehydrogenase small subunit|nr:(2Fe-2S)-binding protein [Candidatus Geocrenenecus arthurdayi]MCL7404176.1 (2Fe-2S)-binding protein [Candidatus Geocrenenecus arthurdayi]